MISNYVTQPLCDHCWYLFRGTRNPTRTASRDWHVCHKCGRWTTSGIYVSVHPDDVEYLTDYDNPDQLTWEPDPTPKDPT
jgi:hypothetical protein